MVAQSYEPSKILSSRTARLGFYIKSNNKINPITSVWVRCPLSRKFCLVCLSPPDSGVWWVSTGILRSSCWNKTSDRLMTSNRNRGSLLRKTLPKEEATRPRRMFRSSTEPLLSRPYRFLVGGSLLCASSVWCRPPWGGRFSGHSLCSFLVSYSHLSSLSALLSCLIFHIHCPPSHSTFSFNSLKAPRVC